MVYGISHSIHICYTEGKATTSKRHSSVYDAHDILATQHLFSPISRKRLPEVSCGLFDLFVRFCLCKAAVIGFWLLGGNTTTSNHNIDIVLPYKDEDPAEIHQYLFGVVLLAMCCSPSCRQGAAFVII